MNAKPQTELKKVYFDWNWRKLENGFCEGYWEVTDLNGKHLVNHPRPYVGDLVAIGDEDTCFLGKVKSVSNTGSCLVNVNFNQRVK